MRPLARSWYASVLLTLNCYYWLETITWSLKFSVVRLHFSIANARPQNTPIMKQSKNPGAHQIPCTMHWFPPNKSVTLDLAISVGMILVQCSQMPGRISNLSLNNLIPTRFRVSAWEIWCWLTLSECDSTFWMQFFSFGGSSKCTGADIHHFGDGFV